jgi:formylglycine-generating enzyme required for sulfatase activity
MVQKTFQDMLNRLVQERSVGVLENRAVCKALLGDYAKGKFKREIRLFLQCLSAGCHRKLLADSASAETRRVLAQSLQDQYGAEKQIAEETITALAQCLAEPQNEENRRIEALRRRAAEGHSLAQYELGSALYALKRYQEAADWFEKSARQSIAPRERPGTAPVPGQPERSAFMRGGFVRINGGIFTMGSPETEPGRSSDEMPHTVSVKGFFMAKCAVTQQEYTAVMGTNPSAFKGGDLPVEQVSWFDAVSYCNARSALDKLTPAYRIRGDQADWDLSAEGYRLPTEAEWEYACRAGTAEAFHTGGAISFKEANYDGRLSYNGGPKGICRGRTTAVGSFPPNRWGLYDMHGNVGEWCWDWYWAYDPRSRHSAGALWGTNRVIRGGSWKSEGLFLRSAYRDSGLPSQRTDCVGFRIVCTSILCMLNFS